mgnify:CR=1 FL=1
MEAQSILICDDEPALRRMLKDHLGECGYAVQEAANAAELFAHLEENLPDLVILDVRMPGMDGLTALRDLRQKSQIPVMLVTS